jgi:hypothetical protein
MLKTVTELMKTYYFLSLWSMPEPCQSNNLIVDFHLTDTPAAVAASEPGVIEAIAVV